MGLGSMIRGGLKAASKVVKNPIASKVAGMVPGLGTVVNAAGLASAAYGGYKAITGVAGNKGLPAMPGGLPVLTGVGTNRSPGLPQPAPGSTGSFGIPRGPGGRMQLPWNDPSVPAFLKQFALDDSYIRPAMRAPRGYVIVRDPDGQPYPILKSIAQKFRLWKPGKKPPISVRDWQALKRSDRTIKKLRKIVTMTTRVDKHVSKGGKVHFTKSKKGKK